MIAHNPRLDRQWDAKLKGRPTGRTVRVGDRLVSYAISRTDPDAFGIVVQEVVGPFLPEDILFVSPSINLRADAIVAIAENAGDDPILAGLTAERVAQPAFQDLLRNAAVVATVIGYMRGGANCAWPPAWRWVAD